LNKLADISEQKMVLKFWAPMTKANARPFFATLAEE